MTRRLMFISVVSLGGLSIIVACVFLRHPSPGHPSTPSVTVQNDPPDGAEPTTRPEPPGAHEGNSGPGRIEQATHMPAGKPADNLAEWLDEQIMAGPSASDSRWMTPLDVLVSKIMADFGKHHALAPGPIRRPDEPNAIGVALAPVRKNFASIRNLSAKVTMQVEGQDYLTGRLVMRDKPTPRMLLDIVTSTGHRQVALYDGRFLFVGQGRAGEPVGLSLAKETTAPADPLLIDVLNRSYQGMTKTPGTSGDDGGITVTSTKYTLTLDPTTGRIRSAQKHAADDMSPKSDVSILRYAEFPDGVYFPSQMQSEDVVGTDKVRSTTTFTDIILNTDELNQPAFADPPSIHIKVGGS